jgi:hypothetical protein
LGATLLSNGTIKKVMITALLLACTGISLFDNVTARTDEAGTSLLRARIEDFTSEVWGYWILY